MSSLTDEWQLKRENGIKYWIDIRDFNKKMNWPGGKEIYSRHFKISESVFSISIYPNGEDSDEKGHVSVFLHNDSSWRVRLSDVSIKMGEHEETIMGRYYQAGESWGIDFLTHKKIRKAKLLDEEDGALILEVDVELLEEEVPAWRSVDDEGDVLLSLKNEISTIKDDLKTEMKDMMKAEFSRMLMIQGMNNNRTSGRAANVECPVCKEEVRAPMRLRQCGEGHII